MRKCDAGTGASARTKLPHGNRLTSPTWLATHHQWDAVNRAAASPCLHMKSSQTQAHDGSLGKSASSAQQPSHSTSTINTPCSTLTTPPPRGRARSIPVQPPSGHCCCCTQNPAPAGPSRPTARRPNRAPGQLRSCQCRCCIQTVQQPPNLPAVAAADCMPTSPGSKGQIVGVPAALSTLSPQCCAIPYLAPAGRRPTAENLKAADPGDSTVAGFHMSS